MLGFRPPTVVVPPGDPDALRAAAGVLLRTAETTGAGAARLGAVSSGLADGWTWCGPRSTTYQQGSAVLVDACRTGAGALRDSSAAVRAYAEDLARAQAAARAAQQQAEQLDRACTSLEWRMAAAQAAGPPSGDPAQQAAAAAAAAAHWAALQREAAVLREAVGRLHVQVQAFEDLVRAAERALTARLSATSGALDGLVRPPAPPKEPDKKWHESALDQVGGFFVGLYDGVAEPVTLVGALAGVGDADASDSWKDLGSGLWHGVTHPKELGKALIGWDDLAAGEYGHWLGSLVPGVVAAFYTGGASAATRATTGVTALQKAGRTLDDLEDLTDAQAAAILMRGAPERPGNVHQDGPLRPGIVIRERLSPSELIDVERKNFVGPIAVQGPVLPERWLAQASDSSVPLRGTPEGEGAPSLRSLRYNASPRDLLGMTSADDYIETFALDPAWGARDQVSVLHVRPGSAAPGHAFTGGTAPQGPLRGGGTQVLLHDVDTSTVVWTGPPPWVPVRDLSGAARDAAQAAAVFGTVRGTQQERP